MLAITPPGATRSWQSSKVAGTPTASMAVSTPLPPVSALTFADASPSALLIVWVAPKRASDLKAIVVKVDHDDLTRRIELSGQQRCEPDGPEPTMATVEPGATLPFRTPHSKPVGRMSLSITRASSSAPAGIR